MSEYPEAVYDPRTKQNKTGVEYNAEETTKIFAEDIVKLDDEVVALQTEIGLNPKGTYTDLVERIEGILRMIKTQLEAGRHYLNFHFYTAIGFQNNTSGNSSTSFTPDMLVVVGGTTVGNYAQVNKSDVFGQITNPTFSKYPEFVTVAKTSQVANQDIYFGLGSKEEGDFLGFYIEDGTLKAHIQYIDPTTESFVTINETISGISVNAIHEYKADFDGTNARYYVDGVLKATITTASYLVESEYNNQSCMPYFYIESKQASFHAIAFRGFHLNFNQ